MNQFNIGDVIDLRHHASIAKYPFYLIIHVNKKYIYCFTDEGGRNYFNVGDEFWYRIKLLNA